MNQEQIDVLNVVQQVLRMFTMSVIAANPETKEALSTMLAASASQPGLHPVAQTMLQDLAAGPAIFESAGKPWQ